ncbi:MAG: hypothetical protein PVH88_22700 [Ignavibacteria bacterium]|jgi:hypothetical protein
MFKRGKPYNDFPLLPPKADLETKEILNAAIAANKALAELKGDYALESSKGRLILLSYPKNTLSGKSIVVCVPVILSTTCPERNSLRKNSQFLC